jgi:hypothetical protein
MYPVKDKDRSILFSLFGGNPEWAKDYLASRVDNRNIFLFWDGSARGIIEMPLYNRWIYVETNGERYLNHEEFETEKAALMFLRERMDYIYDMQGVKPKSLDDAEFEFAEKAVRCKKAEAQLKEYRRSIDHPAYYNQHNPEVIEIIENYNLGFHLGNAIKYILRAPYKGNTREDLKKAIWYLDRYMDLLTDPGEQE